MYGSDGAGVGPARRKRADNRIANNGNQCLLIRKKAMGRRRAYQLAPDGTFMSEHAAGTQYEEAEKTQYASPMAIWRSPVVTPYLIESVLHPVPLTEMLIPLRSLAQIV